MYRVQLTLAIHRRWGPDSAGCVERSPYITWQNYVHEALELVGLKAGSLLNSLVRTIDPLWQRISYFVAISPRD